MPKIVLASGSIRRESANAAVISTVRRLLEQRDESYEVTELSLRHFPLFDEDLESDGGTPELLAAKAQVASADVLIISSPAYNGYPSGVLKNALDWLSRPGDADRAPLEGLPTVVVSASPGPAGGENVQPHVRQILGNCGATLIDCDQVAVGNAIELRTPEGVITEPSVVKALDGLVDAVAGHLSATPQEAAA
ncbi:NADPH-dependent FMN reductase [Streptomyces neyagawaensis]|uniref:NADPH-dependent FMN reductase n=1 Tax=Streptomyces neyagawaensis TaxID=42238 RepID=UPI0006E1459D|nr:NADPH-dependent FMN reductase [Streptomyces neyagawaensis]MCL6733099.1 NAD(P)H-dependent oxidoreductase [Streptomyces neyagawaensis]MDE1687635.1 NAD(P)H-dependent oxidoreductase [Streptomyces neyagawaensis]